MMRLADPGVHAAGVALWGVAQLLPNESWQAADFDRQVRDIDELCEPIAQLLQVDLAVAASADSEEDEEYDEHTEEDEWNEIFNAEAVD